MEYHEFGSKLQKNMAEKVIIDVSTAIEGKAYKVSKYEPVYFQFPILSERGSTIESEALKFKGTHLPINGRTTTSSRISVRGNDTVTIRCYKDKGMVLYRFSIEDDKIVLVTCLDAKNKRKDV